ncbi:MAG: CRISPR-associated protein Cas4 [candidate division WOR-3 bacterium]|nr:CRISPR-associated protein Cas4 [candidate division WOR-3 bacterium]
MDTITGTLIWYYNICKREVWLLAHEITPDPDNQLIQLGSLVHSEAYPQEKKGWETAGMKIDIIKRVGKQIIVGEIKKSDRFLEAAKMQLLFYLYQLKQKGIDATGELLLPVQKKRIPVEFELGDEEKLRKAICEIKEIVKMPYPPPVNKNKFCNKCGYKYFCYA